MSLSSTTPFRIHSSHFSFFFSFSFSFFFFLFLFTSFLFAAAFSSGDELPPLSASKSSVSAARGRFLSAAAISSDIPALLAFKSAVSGDSGDALSDWKASSSSSADEHCRWRGVTCDAATSRVITLELAGRHSSRLAGTLAPALGNLTELKVLSLPYNAFSGEIPAEIGRLRHLEVLELQGNNFSGKIPAEISDLSVHYSLRVVNLSYNYLTGSIPADLVGAVKIRVLDLSNNQLSGKIDLGGSLGQECGSIEHLKLSNNFLVGNIMSQIGKCRNLRTLLLDGNILEGRIPPEIGAMSELRVLDVSRNSLTDSIPKELANCRKLVVLVLTNLGEYSDDRSLDIFRGEYNAFVGGVPGEVFRVPSLQVLWAPRANIGGKLPRDWTGDCSLRVLNLGQNYIHGGIPEGLGLCRNLSFVDLSSNSFLGEFPTQIQVPCMMYLNVSRNSLGGPLTVPLDRSCSNGGLNLEGKDLYGLDEDDVLNAYSSISIWSSQMNGQQGGELLDNRLMVVNHDFSWNNFTGSLPVFGLSDALFDHHGNVSYELLLNNNDFNGSILVRLLSVCSNLHSFSVNLSANLISGEVSPSLFQDCLVLTGFEAAQNQISGVLFPDISKLHMLGHLDLTENQLSGPLPRQLGDLKNLKSLLIGGNNLTGGIPSQLGQLTSLETLVLSKNKLQGSIPVELANATSLEVLLLDHNALSGEIPSSFTSLSRLTELDVSYNNLSGHIPRLPHISDCESFKGNRFLHSCPDPYSMPPSSLPYPLEVHKWHNRSKMKSLIIAASASVSVVIGVLLIIVLGLTVGRKKLGNLTSLRRKVVVTFADAPIELTYENVVSATGNFSIRNLIGTGGFGSTYKAELVPGYLVAVKRLALGRFQGVQQFEAEIKTLGRVRHKNLVTLIGYYVGDTEMFLIYNYLSGGNLDTFIHEHDRSSKDVKWPTVYKIALDVAHALAYLHYSCVPRIVHRDIKPSNILLDEELNAYLSDFGLARLLEVSQTHATTDVAGTFGYVAPEYATTCRVSDKADVYSFGVVLLELMSGKKSLDPSFSEYGNGFNIVGWATLLLQEERASQFFPSQLWEVGPQEYLLRMMRLALSCTLESLSVRPSMKQVLERLKQMSP